MKTKKFTFQDFQTETISSKELKTIKETKASLK